MSDTTALLDRAIIAYYGFSDPIMSDEEFDALFSATYGPDAEPLARYREIFSESGRRRKLTRPMLSLAKVKNAASLTAWIDKARAAGADGVWVAPKYDGLAVLVTTDPDGKIVSAVTRGDGAVGDDVTVVVSHIPGVENLPADSQVQVEVCLPPSRLDEASAIRGKAYTHARNAAAGMLRNTGTAALAGAALLVIERHFDRDGATGPFPVDTEASSRMATELTNFREETLVEMDVLTDGAVLWATKDSEPLTSMGHDGITPRWAVAWKYPDDAVHGTITEVIWQAGRTKTTPVAVFSPSLDFDGVSVTRATLHNIDFIRGLDLHVGDVVSVIRSGQVIPYVTGLVTPGTSRGVITEPARIGDDAPEFWSSLAAHMAEVLGVYGAGPSVTDAVAVWARGRYPDAEAREGLIRALGDLSDPALAAEVVSGKVRPAKLAAEVSRATAEADRTTWLAALGYRGIGRRMSRKLVARTGSVTALLDALATPETLYRDGVGPKTLAPLTENLTEVRRLLDEVAPNPEAGLDAAEAAEVASEVTSEVTIKGKVVLTGALDIPRKEIETMLAEAGYELASSVSKTTLAVITPDATGGSSKLAKAAKLSVPVVEVSAAAEVVPALDAL